ncbi:unnamed protein product [Blepharisma stoltei]|uniref:Uncharacterized protein n=1 Tax=Blepharisma stoltei TaxID=1481888 RepID=A0AAU9IZ32_9CILI|nr:unnamed protein product [Blepharisma stoltei]
MAYQSLKLSTRDSFLSSCSNSDRSSTNLRSQFKKISDQLGTLTPLEKSDIASLGSSFSTSSKLMGHHTRKPQRHFTCFTPKSPTLNFQISQDQMITNIIQDCDLIKDEIVGALKSATKDAKSAKKDVLITSQIERSDKFHSLLHEGIFEQEKRKIEENYKNLHYNEELSKKYEKVRSLLAPSREGNSRLPNIEENEDRKDHCFITKEDLTDGETAYILSINKRCFGESFSPNVKESPEKICQKAKTMISAKEISPEETILTDIKSIMSKKNDFSPKKVSSSRYSGFKSNSDRILEKIKNQPTSPSMQQNSAGLDRIGSPSFSPIKKKNSLPQLKLNYPGVKNKVQDSSPKEKFNQKKGHKGEIHVNYFKKRTLDKNLMEAFKDIKLEPKDFKLKRKVEKLMTTRQNLIYTNKELSLKL